MKKLNSKNAKEFGKEIINKGLPKLYAKFYIIHSEFVIKAAKELAKEKNLKGFDELFEIAGYLHDIGYTIESKGHAKHSFKLIKEEFGEIDPILEDCILNHGRSKSPQTEKGKIFQLADKLSSFYPDFMEKLFDLEKQEGMTLKESLEQLKKRLEKSMKLYKDKDYKKLAIKYYDEFVEKYKLK